MKTITESEFKNKADGTLIVQFSASWCGPCKSLTRTIESCQDSLKNKIYKMDIDTINELASILKIVSVPTLVRFEGGKEVNRIIGNQTVPDIQKFAS